MRTYELAQFVRWASGPYNFDPAKVVALGYSNGANVAASILLLSPQTLAGAILIRPMVPLVPERLPSLQDECVLTLAGRADTIVSPQQSEELQQLLRRAGADAELRWIEGGHALTEDDITISRRWFSEHFESPKR